MNKAFHDQSVSVLIPGNKVSLLGCQMNLKDSDGNLFSTTFTHGIKKVIDFLMASFDASIPDVENKITF